MIQEQSSSYESAEKALLRKIDLRLIPLLTLLYFLSYLDRINIGNARLFGLENDLHLSESQYHWAVSIFFVSYVLCEVPSNLFLEKFGLPKWIGSLMFVWGTILIVMAFIRTATGLFVVRFCLGVAEAGLFPGVIFYLTLWYIREDQTLRMGIFFCGAILAGAFGGILAYGIGQLDNLGDLNGWQWIFLVEGTSTVCLAVVTYKVLAGYPSECRWLNPNDQATLINRLRRHEQRCDDDIKRSFQSAIRDWKVPCFMLINLGALTPVFCFSSFLPSIIEQMNYKNVTAQLLTVPPYAGSGVITILSAWNAGRLNEHGYHIMICLLIGISGFLYLILMRKLLYIGACMASIGVFSAYALVPSWVTTNIEGQTKRAIVIAVVTSFGSIGGIFGGQIYRNIDAPYFYQEHRVVLGIMCVTFILVLIMKLLLICENRRRGSETSTQPLLGDAVDERHQPNAT